MITDRYVALWRDKPIPDLSSFRYHKRAFLDWYQKKHSEDLRDKRRAAGAKKSAANGSRHCPTSNGTLWNAPSKYILHGSSRRPQPSPNSSSARGGRVNARIIGIGSIPVARDRSNTLPCRARAPPGRVDWAWQERDRRLCSPSECR